MKDIRDLPGSLGRVPGIRSGFVQAIPKDKLGVRRGEEFWTVGEHVIHLASIQHMMLGRFKRFVDEEHPEFVPYDPAKTKLKPEAVLPIAEAAPGQFAAYRNRQLLLLEKADNDTWKKTATHPEYEACSLYICQTRAHARLPAYVPHRRALAHEE